MSRLLLLSWLLMALLGHLTAGHSSTEIPTEEEDSTVKQLLDDHQQLLDKQTAMEQDMKALRHTLLAPWQYSVAGLGSSADFLELKNKLLADLEEAKRTMQGSTFVRWGRKTCSSPGQLVYSGVAGGSWYTHTGAAANYLCLTMNPQFDFTPLPSQSQYTFLFGAEYQSIGRHHQLDVPCSVCHTPHSTTLMIPTTHSCPAGWTVQYTGFLSSGLHTYEAANEFVCLDGAPEDTTTQPVSQDGKLFYYVAYQCGTLPCPPYVNNKIVLCVVCSK